MFREQIEAGAKLLDEKVPGWVDKIDLEELDLGDCSDCAIGQVFPDDDFSDALRDLLGIHSDEVHNLSHQYGFCIPPGGNWGDYSQLTQEWIEYIDGRLEA